MGLSSIKVAGLLFIIIIGNLWSQEQSRTGTSYSDTTYSAVNGKISSITTYVDSLVQSYEGYYVNGELSIKILYSHENQQVVKEDIYDGGGNQYAFGTYLYNDNGYLYEYFLISGKKVSSSDYNNNGSVTEYRIINPDGNIYSKSCYVYDDEGYLNTEKYYDYSGVLVAEGVWTYDADLDITKYLYQLAGDAVYGDSYSNRKYNSSETYYSIHTNPNDSSLSFFLKDSTIFKLDSSSVYTAQFSYNNLGYMVKDRYIDTNNSIIGIGSYEFDSDDYITTYTYDNREDSTIWVTTSDYKGLNNRTVVSKDGTIESITDNIYNSSYLIDTVVYKDGNSIAHSIGTYKYYDESSFLKSWLYSTVNGDTITYRAYNSMGDVTEEVAISAGVKPLGKNYNISIINRELKIDGFLGSAGKISIFTANGRMVLSGSISKESGVISLSPLSAGSYISLINADGSQLVYKFIIN
jgi:hypothetical protein